MTTALPDDPIWLVQGFKFEGFHEVGNNRGIEQFISLAGTGSLGDPWCAIFANAMLQSVGVHGTRSPAARSFSKSEFFSHIDTPRRGCIVVLWRGSPTAETGHVGFFLSVGAKGIQMLSGNDDDQVEVAYHPEDRLIGYYWPTTAPALPPPSQQPPTTVPGPDDHDLFPVCVAVTLKWEGGNDDDPDDPGGRTSRGILQREWDVWRLSHPGLPSDVWQAPQSEILAIYRQNYWNRLMCQHMDPGVNLAVFDFCVNSGGGLKVIQRAVGVTDDGEMGPDTLTHIQSLIPAALINDICDRRMKYLQTTPAWKNTTKFRAGLTNRVADIRRQALAMQGTVPVPTKEPPVTPQLPPLVLPPPTQGPSINVDGSINITMDQLKTMWAAEQQIMKGRKQMGAALLPLIMGLLPHLGTAGVALTQIAAFMQLAPAIPGLATNGSATTVITSLMAIASGVMAHWQGWGAKPGGTTNGTSGSQNGGT